MSEAVKPAKPLKTPLYDAHVDAGARIIDFGGWALPVHYGSQVEEHHAVRRTAGVFDVSHMTITDIRGDDTIPFLRKLLANDIARITASAERGPNVSGRAIYSCMLNQQGGVIDDLITYYQSADWCRMVTNAATREKDLAWLRRQSASFSVELTERPDLAIIAVQGPAARDAAVAAFPAPLMELTVGLARFQACQFEEWYVGRTGYTGEDGFEIILPAGDAPGLWDMLLRSGIQPCGLGARDTLRLEAGMSLYGSDLSEEYTPLDSGLGWSVSMDDPARSFIGREALQRQGENHSFCTMTGLLLEGRGVLRAHQDVFADGEYLGEVTSGTFSPTLEKSIALARLSHIPATGIEGEIRGKRLPVRAVRYPFVRNGRPRIQPIDAATSD